MRRTIVLAAALAVVAVPLMPHLAKAGQGAVRRADRAEDIRTVSRLRGLDFAPLHKLPRAPSPAKGRTGCASEVIEPVTDAGRKVASYGWAVTGEATIGRYRAVSFAGRLGQDKGGGCLVGQGNVGIFVGEKLIAVAYARRLSNHSIGHIALLEGGTVRLWSGETPSLPVGDIQALDGGHLLQLGALAPEEKLCGGTATVPNIYGMPIDKARRALAAKGWVPVSGKALSDGGQKVALARRGLAEVESCSGGLDFCSFRYSEAGDLLSVTTVGADDFPDVVNYRVRCP